jgi:hypothetical protein
MVYKMIVIDVKLTIKCIYEEKKARKKKKVIQMIRGGGRGGVINKVFAC